MTGVTIQNLPVTSIVEAEQNPNRMEEARFNLLRNAIEKQGFLQPVLVQTIENGSYRVIDGHHRLRAARELGMPKVPCVVVVKGSDEEKVLRVAMNQLRGELDLTSVARIVQELSTGGWTLEQLTQTGFSEAEVADLLRSVSQEIETGLNMTAPASDVLGDDTKDDRPSKLLVLEIPFSTRAHFKKAKAGLEKIGEGDISLGLLRLLAQTKKITEVNSNEENASTEVRV